MIRNIYKSHLPSVNYFFANGMQAAFLMGRFETADTEQIRQLDAEVKSGHPHIYVDSAEATIDSEAPTPMELIRQEAYAQAKADLLASGAVSAKVSESDSGEFAKSVTNTANIQEAAMGSDNGSASMAAASAAPPAATGASLMALSALSKAGK